VMLTASGPVVIDWPNVCLGARGTDVANTWLIVATSEIDAEGPQGRLQSAGRSWFLRAFLADSDLVRARPQLAGAAEHRLTDRNLRSSEAENIRELLRNERL